VAKAVDNRTTRVFGNQRPILVDCPCANQSRLTAAFPVNAGSFCMVPNNVIHRDSRHSNLSKRTLFGHFWNSRGCTDWKWPCSVLSFYLSETLQDISRVSYLAAQAAIKERKLKNGKQQFYTIIPALRNQKPRTSPPETSHKFSRLFVLSPSPQLRQTSGPSPTSRKHA
jgi:hypothetical protein